MVLFFPISLNLLFPRVHPCVCEWIHEDPLFPIPPGVYSIIPADGAPVDSWPYFPGLKVGKTFISILTFWLFGGVGYNQSWLSMSTIIPELLIRNCFSCISQLCLLVNNQIQKCFNLNTSSKVKLDNFYWPRGHILAPPRLIKGLLNFNLTSKFKNRIEDDARAQNQETGN